ncbi:MAG: phosphoribosyltransferase [Candidatus Micrarchaeota archaeon]|nr:phosphoribosyltransferase [Candidatus Micrarchaeota archaeon]
MIFKDREDAGRELGWALAKFAGPDTIVLAIPRGGVVTGRAVAKALGCQLDIITPRKLKDPQDPELAIGAVTPDGNVYLNERVIAVRGVDKSYIEKEARAEQKEAERRLKEFRGGRPYPNLKGKPVIIVDDGIATGATIIAAARDAKRLGASRIIIAVPVIAESMIMEIAREVDDFVYLVSSPMFVAVGQFYKRFGQVEDKEVIGILSDYWKPSPSA